MSKHTTPPAAQTKQQKGFSITVDTGCPYCRGKRGHSSNPSQRKACKAKGPIKEK